MAKPKDEDVLSLLDELESIAENQAAGATDEDNERMWRTIANILNHTYEDIEQEFKEAEKLGYR